MGLPICFNKESDYNYIKVVLWEVEGGRWNVVTENTHYIIVMIRYRNNNTLLFVQVHQFVKATCGH